VAMVTSIQTEEIIAGELVSLPDLFIDVVLFIPILAILGCVLIMINLLNKRMKKRIYILSMIFGIITFLGSFLIFYFSMSELTSLGIGSIVGEGYHDLTIPGEGTLSTIYCYWGPSYFLYVYGISFMILILIFILDIRKDKRR
jgi:hypothetical protein